MSNSKLWILDLNTGAVLNTYNINTDDLWYMQYNYKENYTIGTDIITACDSLTWIDGITYSSSNNTATQHFNNSKECDSIITLNLTINNCDSSIIIPTILTPNEDGVNDLFLPFVGLDLESINTSIFNRWGQLIYQSNQIN